MLKIKDFKNINNHPLVLEYKYLINQKYKNLSIFEEEKTNRFLKNYE